MCFRLIRGTPLWPATTRVDVGSVCYWECFPRVRPVHTPPVSLLTDKGEGLRVGPDPNLSSGVMCEPSSTPVFDPTESNV